MTIRVCVILPGDIRREQLWQEQSKDTAISLGFEWHITPPPEDVSSTEWQDLIGDVDAIITSWNTPRLTGNVLPRTNRLKVIAHAAGSVEPIVSHAIFDRGIKLLSANRYMAWAVAEYYLMMAMVGLRHLTVNAQIGNMTKVFPHFNEIYYRSVDEVSIAIWGLGDVAKHLIFMYRNLGVQRILVHSDQLTIEQAKNLGVEKVGFETIFQQGDVVNLCESLRDDTFERVTRVQLDMMKEHSVLINAGRARLIREVDLLAELKRRRITGILDVHYVEPLPLNSSFRKLDNVILTPHIAGTGPFGRARYIPIMLQEIKRLLDGHVSEYEITPDRALMMTNNQLV